MQWTTTVSWLTFPQDEPDAADRVNEPCVSLDVDLLPQVRDLDIALLSVLYSSASCLRAPL